MEKMNNSTPNNMKDNLLLGKKDMILDHNSNWIIYKLNLLDKNGLWLKFKNKLNELKENNILVNISNDDIMNYYYQNPDVEFELLVFDDIMQKHNLFKIKDIMYSYSIGKKTKNTKNIAYVRFYFNLNEFFKY